MTQADSTSVLGRSLEETEVPRPAFKSTYPAYSPLVYAPVGRRDPRIQEEPLDLGTERLEPVPMEGCTTCAALVKKRAEAQLAGDFSRASDCNVEIYQHPHSGRGRLGVN